MGSPTYIPVLSGLRRGFRRMMMGAGALGILLSTRSAGASTLPGLPGRPPCPSDMALVGNVCVDRYEASLVEISASGAETPYSPYVAPNGHAVRAVSRPGVKPQAHISMVEAQKACKASGKRLCHAKEWVAACRGPEKTKYPYGNDRMPGVCVDTQRTSPIQTVKKGRYDHASMNDPILNQLPNTLEPTGAASACTNGYGVHDMVGNIHEWVDDGTFHGGYYLDTKINGEGCSYRTSAHGPSYYDYSTGFRCCADADSVPVEEEPTRDVEPRLSEAPSKPPADEGGSQSEATTSLAFGLDSLVGRALEGRLVDGEVEAPLPLEGAVGDRKSYYPV